MADLDARLDDTSKRNNLPGRAISPVEIRLQIELEAAFASVERILQSLHLTWAAGEIVGPDELGRFPAALVRSVPPVIVDANVLRNDVIYACRNDRKRTILVNAANAGFLRLFCADHVIGEVADHFGEWSAQTDIEPSQFESVWMQQYLPLLRSVSSVPYELLSRSERHRVRLLNTADPDDVPSVALALLLGGFYLSQDGPATTAVFGHARDQAELRQWREALAAGGDAGAIYWMFEASMMTARIAGLGMGGLFSAIRGLPPWLQGVISGAAVSSAVLTWKNVDPDSKERLSAAFERAAHLLGAVSKMHQTATDRLNDVCAPLPSAQELAVERSPQEVLARAVLIKLARSREGLMTAAEIAHCLPALPVAQGEAKIREMLQSQTCATEISRGRWQLGMPVVWESN